MPQVKKKKYSNVDLPWEMSFPVLSGHALTSLPVHSGLEVDLAALPGTWSSAWEIAVNQDVSQCR
jgi:steroid 5-alpha reductase family enzyme